MISSAHQASEQEVSAGTAIPLKVASRNSERLSDLEIKPSALRFELGIGGGDHRDSRNTTLNLVTGLNATINSSLSTRFSYAAENDSNPPPGAVQTDTLSRVTLIYYFCANQMM